MPVSKFISIGQHICFLTAVIANSLLLYLIKIRAGSSFGRYRIMMICFSLYSIFYATVETLTLPVMHIHGSGILFYADSFLKHDLTWGMVIITAYCGCFAFCISTLAVHFVFRYIAVCRSNKLYYFDGFKLYLWFIPPCLMFTAWATCIQLVYVPNPDTRDFFRSMTREVYEEDIDTIAYVGPVYYTLCFTTCIICAYKTYKKLNDFSTQMSTKTRALNKQLFWTLGLQTLLPCLTQYMPVGLLFVLPLFEIEVGKVGNIVGVTCCLYPAMDPLVAIFMIDRFRNCVLRKEERSKTRSGRKSAYTSDKWSSNNQ
ncbi:hypothetical protein CAEBREN_16874 [Caenorhabditis brenneri]|uniref:Serpentine receptor class r-10 n=1 Tax=Caenorhabditis brenneri TaxID=135651 RepID=G0P525_CAEBE|nr:hypothetical protein CAEBREN_16874 [Caenorhabditis brenneri]